MKLLTFVICMTMLYGCSTMYDNGNFENHLMRAPISDKHGTMERFEGTGVVVRTIGDNVAPEIILGKYAHTQMFLPLIKCITYYAESGSVEKTECQSIPSWTVEAQVSAQGGRIGDIIKTGDAVKYSSSYEAWIQSLKTQVLISDIDERTKADYIESLDNLSNTLNNQ